MRCGNLSPGFPFLARCLWPAVLTLLLPSAGSLPALPSISNVSSALNVSELFPIPDSTIALRFWAFGSEVEAGTLQSILIVSIAFVREQIRLHGEKGHPVGGELRYVSSDGLEILIRNAPDDPDSMDLSQLQIVVYGLWDYIITGMRYRTATFDVLDVDADAQIGWGHIVKQARHSLPIDTVKERGLQLPSPPPPSSSSPSAEVSISNQHNSSLSTTPLSTPIYWPIDDSDLALQFTYPGSGPRSRKDPLDPEAVRKLFLVVIELSQDALKTKGADVPLGGPGFSYHRDGISLKVVNWPHMVTWGQVATVVLGLIDFIVDHDHYYCWYFSIYTQKPKVELGIGSLLKGYSLDSNVTVARRRSVDRTGEKERVLDMTQKNGTAT